MAGFSGRIEVIEGDITKSLFVCFGRHAYESYDEAVRDLLNAEAQRAQSGAEKRED